MSSPVPPIRGRAGAPRIQRIPADRLDDPREQQNWFLRLPERAKQEYRARWRAQEGRTAGGSRRIRWTYQRFILESAGVFSLAQLVFVGPASALGGALYGAIGGLAAARLRAGTFAYAFVGAATYGIYSATTEWGHMLGFGFYTGLCALLGLVHVLQRSDGTEC